MTKTFARTFSFLFIILTIYGCPTSQLNKQAAWEKEIMKVDNEFSNACKSKGMKNAFIEYMDDDGILLRPDHPPIIGANAIEYLTQQNDSSYSLTWEPSSAKVSEAGDLGFTYGIYNLEIQDTILHGTYASIWKKQKDGKWKFVLDTGNPGINNPQDSSGH